jgi:hypothetical protein
MLTTLELADGPADIERVIGSHGQGGRWVLAATGDHSARAVSFSPGQRDEA